MSSQPICHISVGVDARSRAYWPGAQTKSCTIDRVLSRLVKRMMRDPRARALADGFAAQWLGISALGVTVRPDSKVFPEFTEELAAAMREETLAVLRRHCARGQEPAGAHRCAIHLSQRALAALYKIDGVKGPEMRRVALDDPSSAEACWHTRAS